MLLEFCSANNLYIAKNEDAILTYYAIQDCSWVDLTIFQLKKDSRFINWRVQDEESMSDHQEIEFEYQEVVEEQ